MPTDWDPDQYALFESQRAQPFWDLVALIRTDRPIADLVDLGCGPGVLTAQLCDRLDVDDAVGIDSSPAMLERAAGVGRDRLRFALADIGSWCEPSGYDVVVANASLHWVPDHAATLQRWTASLRPGGQLAVQVPANADQVPYLVAAEVAHEEPFLSALDGDPPPDVVAVNVRPPEWYARALHDLGFVTQHVRLQVYDHLLPGTDAVVEWLRGTTLTRFFDALPPELHEPFVDRYRAALIDAVGDRRPHFFPFKRILMWARRSG